MNRHPWIFTTGALLLGAHLALGQSTADVAAYRGIMLTPVGGFSPLMTSTLVNRLQNGASFAFRYGHEGSGGLNGSQNLNNFGFSAILPLSLGSTASLTAGAIVPDCSGCHTKLTLGGEADMRVYATPFGMSSTSPLITISLDGQLGYTNRDPGSFFAGYVGAPFALVVRGTGMQFVPYLTPGFGFAQEAQDGSSVSGALFMIGGGLGIYNKDNSVMVSVGFNYVFASQAQTMLGLMVSVGGK
jgi:hypothetical protein